MRTLAPVLLYAASIILSVIAIVSPDDPPFVLGSIALGLAVIGGIMTFSRWIDDRRDAE